MHNIKVQRFLISHLLTSFSQQQTDDFHTHIYIQRERERESTFWQVEAERREARGVYEAFGGDLSDRFGVVLVLRQVE